MGSFPQKYITYFSLYIVSFLSQKSFLIKKFNYPISDANRIFTDKSSLSKKGLSSFKQGELVDIDLVFDFHREITKSNFH